MNIVYMAPNYGNLMQFLHKNHTDFISQIYSYAKSCNCDQFLEFMYAQLNTVLPLHGWCWWFEIVSPSGEKDTVIVADHFDGKSEFLIYRLDYQTCKEPKVYHHLMIGQTLEHKLSNASIQSYLDFLAPIIFGAFHFNLANTLSLPDDCLRDSAVLSKRGLFVQISESLLTKMRRLGIMKHKWQILDGQLTENPKDLLRIMPCMVQNGEQLYRIGISIKALIGTLTPRQNDICRQLVQGKTDKAIANNLAITPQTVSNHLKGIFKLFDFASRAEAIRTLIRYGSNYD